MLRLRRGLRRFRSTTTSDRATVIPPPVKAFLMLNASPIKRAPAVGQGVPDVVLLGIDLMFPFLIEAKKAWYSSGGT